jgi:hypothetical protein
MISARRSYSRIRALDFNGAARQLANIPKLLAIPGEDNNREGAYSPVFAKTEKSNAILAPFTSRTVPLLPFVFSGGLTSQMEGNAVAEGTGRTNASGGRHTGNRMPPVLYVLVLLRKRTKVEREKRPRFAGTGKTPRGRDIPRPRIAFELLVANPSYRANALTALASSSLISKTV